MNSFTFDHIALSVRDVAKSVRFYQHVFDLTVGNIDSYYNSYAFIPVVRNNVVNKEKLRIFAEVGFGLGAINYDADTGSLRNVQHENLSGGISILNLGLGGNYFFNEKFGLELIIPYLSAKNITSENSNMNAFQAETKSSPGC